MSASTGAVIFISTAFDAKSVHSSGSEKEISIFYKDTTANLEGNSNLLESWFGLKTSLEIILSAITFFISKAWNGVKFWLVDN